MALPAVITALVALANANVPSGVTVSDGEPSQDAPTGDTILVIGTGVEQDLSGDQDLGRLAQWDTYDILGYVRSSSGNLTYAQDRNNAWNAWAAFRNAVQKLPNLSGGALTPSGWIRPAEASYTQTTEADLEQGAEGVYAQVDFRLTVTDLVRAT